MKCLKYGGTNINPVRFTGINRFSEKYYGKTWMGL